MVTEVVGRFAPSPTGALHLGNARTFLIAWLRCRSQGGRMLMRMEDLDHPRVKPETVGQVYEDLRWLGLDWDEPVDESGNLAAYVQSERLEYYRQAFNELKGKGLLYPCRCSRKDIEESQSAPHERGTGRLTAEEQKELYYPGFCREKSIEQPDNPADCSDEKAPAWRFRVDPGTTRFDDVFCGVCESDVSVWSGDFVVARNLSAPSYQLAVVVDDAAMGVTEVVRADDLLLSTHRQLKLYKSLVLNPPAFLHVPLVVGTDGRRLAKRHGDTRISEIRRCGTSPESVIGWLAYTCGWCEFGAQISAKELIRQFRLDTISIEPYVVGASDLRLLGLAG